MYTYRFELGPLLYTTNHSKLWKKKQHENDMKKTVEKQQQQQQTSTLFIF